MKQKQVIILLCQERSGSTMVWNLFHHVSICTAYFEPLNPGMLVGAMFERKPSPRMRHYFVDEVWAEYREFDMEVLARKQEAARTLEWPKLREYLDYLVDGAPQPNVMFKTFRMWHCIEELKEHYGDRLVLLHLCRDLEAQRRSFDDVVANPSGVLWRMREYFGPLWPGIEELDDFAFYAAAWSWCVSVGWEQSDVSVGYEGIVKHPELNILEMFDVCGFKPWVPTAVPLVRRDEERTSAS